MGKKTAKKSQAQKKASQGSSRKVVVLICCIALVAIAAAVFAGYVYLEYMSLDGIILDNISVAGVDVGGMTQREAIAAVDAATVNTFPSSPMKVTVLDTQIEIPTELCGTLNVRAAVRAAYRFGNTGSEAKRKEEQDTAMSSGYTVDIIPYLNIDEDGIRAKLAELGENYNTTLSQSTWEIVGTAPSQALKITLGIPEYGLNLNLLYNKVLETYNQNQFEVTGHCGIIEPAPIDLDAIYQEHCTDPVNATFDPKTFEVIDGKDGYGFNLQEAKEKLASTDYGATLEIPFETYAPETSGETLKKYLFRDELSSYTSASSSSSNRDTNLRLACEAINGVVLYPGEVFSYNETLGERTPERGYKPAASYIGSETVNTYGGGICQVSSTLYYCALMADLEIVSRANHAFANSYVPLGMDATVYWDSLDFLFKNNTNYPIRIEASASGGKATVRLIGTDEKNYYVKMEYETLEVYRYNVVYEEMAPDNPKGYKDGQYITTPYTGYFVKSYRCKFDKYTDALISRTFEVDSKYNKRDAVICKITSNTTEPTGTTEPTAPSDPAPGIGNGGVTDNSGLLPDA